MRAGMLSTITTANGTFTDVTAGSGLEHKPENVLSVGAAWFDYDNDGLLDLIVTNYTTWTPQTDKQCFKDAKHEEYCSPTDLQKHRVEALSQPWPWPL
jgi:enediyne biosynthesis protein E4